MDVVRIIEQAVTGLGFDLVDFESSPKGRLLRVFIDLPAGGSRGVTVDDCAAVSRHLTYLLAAEKVDYDRLEISSPGLDRPLKRQADFERFAGQDVQLRLRVPLNGQRNFTGTLCAAGDGRIRFRHGEQLLDLELGQVEKARLVPKYELR